MHYNYGSEDSLLLRCQLSLNTSVDLLQVKISKVLFFLAEIDKLILKCLWKHKRLSQNIEKEK